MNMDYMSQFMGPGLGGIMAGTEQRQMEDKRFADTQKTLQDILASQGQEAERAALLPGKLATEADRAAMAPLARQEAQGRIDAATAKERADTMTKYIDAQIKYGDGPGGQETIAQEFPKMTNHPISKAAQEILIKGRTDPEGAKKDWEALREKISTSAATIEKRQQEEAKAAAAEKAQAAALRKATEVATIQAKAKIDGILLQNQNKLDSIIAKAKSPSKQSHEQAETEATHLIVDADSILRDPGATPEQKEQAIKDKSKAIQLIEQIKLIKDKNAEVKVQAAGAQNPDVGLKRPGFVPSGPQAIAGAPNLSSMPGIPVQGGAQAAPMDPRAAAMDAIAKGADKAAVAARYKQATGQNLE